MRYQIYVGGVERGQTMVSLKTMLKIAYGLDCSLADLLAEFTSARIKKLFA